MSQINANSHIYKMQVFSQMNFVQFIEDSLFVVSIHPIANIFTSIIFYVILILDSILLVVQHDESVRNRGFEAIDILYYITTFTVENPNTQEANISSIASLAILITYIVILAIVILLQIDDFPFLRSLFCFLCYYAIPITFPTLVNCFLIAYKNASSYDLSLSIMFILHIFFILLIAYIIIMNFFSSFFVNHPFCVARPFQCSFYFIYIIIFTLCIVSKEEWLLYVRLVLAILVTIYCIIQPPYFSRFENFFSFLFLINEIVCVCLYLFTKSRGDRIRFYIYTFPCLIAFDLIMIFILYPFVLFKLFQKPKVVSLFFREKMDQCKEALESMNINELTKDEIRFSIAISLHLHCNNSIDLILLYNQKIRYIHEAIFVWIANSRLNSYRDMMPKKMMRVSTQLENKINEDNEKFWINVLCSNIYDLPEIASQIGRNQYRLLKYNSFLNRKFPSLMISTEIFQYNRKPKCFSFIYYVSLFDFFFLFAFCSLFIGHIFFLSSGNQMSDYMSKFFVIRDYTTNYLLLLTDLWTSKPNFDDLNISIYNRTIKKHSISSTLDSLNDSFLGYISSTSSDGSKIKMSDISIHWDAMMSNFSLFTSFMSSYNFQPLEDLVKNFYIFMPKLEEYIISYMIMPEFSQSAPYFPHEEFAELITLLDKLFVHIYEIYENLTHKQTYICNMYFYTIIILISAFLIISIVSYVIVIRQRTIQFFESFRTCNKTDIAEKCHGQFVKTARNPRFRLLKALPAMVVYLVVLFISVFILIMILFLNKYSDDSNRSHILTATHGFSFIERTYIWLVSSITHYNFMNYSDFSKKEYQQSLIKTDQIADDVRSNSTLNDFTQIITDDLMESIGNSLISFNVPSLFIWRNMLCESIELNQERTDYYDYLPHLAFARFFMFVICNFFAYFLLAYFLIEIEPYYEWGRQEFLNKAEEAGILFKFRSQKVKDDDFPLNYFLVDKHAKVLFATNFSKSTETVHVGKPLKSNPDIEFEINKLKEEKTQNYIQFKTNHNRLIYIVPSYDFSTKSIKFRNALIFICKNERSLFSIEFYRKLFYTVYPTYLNLNDDKLMIAERALKQQYIMIIVKLVGLNDWSMKIQTDDFSKYRRTLSSIVSNRCEEDSTFCRLRETSDMIILGMKQEQKTITRWDLLKTSSSFANDILNIVKTVNKDFNNDDTRVNVTLFKCTEPKTVIGHHRMELTDFKSDIIFKAEERACKSISDSVVYTPQLKELNATNASKIKSCNTSNGETFDLWLVV